MLWRLFGVLLDLDVGVRAGGLGMVPSGMSATLPRGIGMTNGTQPVMGFGKWNQHPSTPQRLTFSFPQQSYPRSRRSCCLCGALFVCSVSSFLSCSACSNLFSLLDSLFVNLPILAMHVLWYVCLKSYSKLGWAFWCKEAFVSGNGCLLFEFFCSHVNSKQGCLQHYP